MFADFCSKNNFESGIDLTMYTENHQIRLLNQSKIKDISMRNYRNNEGSPLYTKEVLNMSDIVID